MSAKKNFFKPTLLYKEYMILNMIEKDPHVTQRHMSNALGVAVSMVNSYIDTYEKQGLLNKEHITTKTVKYHITKLGIERRKLLNIWYLESANKLYNEARDNIYVFLKKMIEKDCKEILLYGAGEVAEILLHTISTTQLPIHVLAVIDDDFTKHGSELVGRRIISLNEINGFKHDAVFISSYTNHEAIYENLVRVGYPKDRIVQFFDI